MFWCIALYLGAFGNVSLLHETRCKMGWSSAIKAEVRAMKLHQNFSQRTHLIVLNSCLCASRSVWVHLAIFCYCTKLGAKWAELVQLMQKFLPRSRIGIFHNERTRSTPLDPKLMFWCISLYLDLFGNVSWLHETRWKTGWTGAINAQVWAMKSFWNFSQRMHPTHPIGP